LTNARKCLAVSLCVVLSTSLLFMLTPSRSSPGIGEYDTWADINDDGQVDIYDAIALAGAFGTSGTSAQKASIEFDSGWINITDRCGQNIVVTHNLNSTDSIVDIQGKNTLDSGPQQRYYGLTGITTGWSKTYRGIGVDFAWDLVQTVDGGYALAGGANVYGTGGGDFWLVKTDASGAEQWNKTYGGTDGDVAYALVQTNDAGYALAGETYSSGAGWADAWLVKTDSSGTEQWNRTYGGTAGDWANTLVQTSDGGYALAGVTVSFGAGNPDAWLAKTDASGNMLWNKTYGGTGSDWALDLVQTVDGGYALAGYTDSFGAVSYVPDFWLVKTDASGNMQWNKTYGGTDADFAYALVQTNDAGYALAGYTSSFGAGNEDFWLVKTDASGTEQWNKTYGGKSFDFAWDLVQTVDGGYALAGSANLFGVSSDAWLVKTDASGNMQWNKTYGGTSADEAQALVQTVDGGYALGGYTLSFGADNSDFWLVKTEVESGLAWVDSSANNITLYRGETDPYWNFVRVRLWKPR
jgi:hypothetical protein